MEDLIKILEEASKRYYEGDPIMSDERFDSLSEYVGWKKVGFNQDPDSEYHEYRMYSLQKFFIGEDEIPKEKGTIVTPKLDGSAISILYKDGKLIKALTRGDGIKGQNITEKIRHLVPDNIPVVGRLQITGEVVVPSSYENARNLAAGSLNLKNIEDVKSRPLTFIVYDSQPHRLMYWSDELIVLREFGFNTILDSDYNEFPKDGSVFRINNNDDYHNLGYTAHHPRGAWAVKKQKEAVVTKLIDVVWQVGRSGRITPVAILDPVNIEGATVSKATLNNFNFIQEMGLEIGCYVEIVRSGEIIPKVLAKVDV